MEQKFAVIRNVHAEIQTSSQVLGHHTLEGEITRMSMKVYVRSHVVRGANMSEQKGPFGEQVILRDVLRCDRQ